MKKTLIEPGSTVQKQSDISVQILDCGQFTVGRVRKLRSCSLDNWQRSLWKRASEYDWHPRVGGGSKVAAARALCSVDQGRAVCIDIRDLVKRFARRRRPDRDNSRGDGGPPGVVGSHPWAFKMSGLKSRPTPPSCSGRPVPLLLGTRLKRKSPSTTSTVRWLS